MTRAQICPNLPILIGLAALVTLMLLGSSQVNAIHFYKVQSVNQADSNQSTDPSSNSNEIDGASEVMTQPRVLREMLDAVEEVLAMEALAEISQANNGSPNGKHYSMKSYVPNQATSGRGSHSLVQGELLGKEETKRESGRWNHLRGMWGKRSVSPESYYQP